jgi:hypothetical protein
MPREKITTCHGAPRSTLPVWITLPRPAITSRRIAPAAATALTGTPRGSSRKNPASNNANTIHPARNVAASRIASRGSRSAPTS